MDRDSWKVRSNVALPSQHVNHGSNLEIVYKDLICAVCQSVLEHGTLSGCPFKTAVRQLLLIAFSKLPRYMTRQSE